MSAKDTPSIQCFVGEPYWNGTEWACPTGVQCGDGFPCPTTEPILRSGVLNNNGRRGITTNSPPNPNTTTGTGINISATGLVEWVKGHKAITASAIALLIYFLFIHNGGKFAGKVRTDITRWGS